MSDPRPPGRLRALATGLLLDRRPARLLLVTGAVDSWGTGLYTAISILYFTTVLDFSVASVGAAMSVASLLAFVVSPRLGRLADRFGPRRTLLVMYLLRGIGYSLYALTDQYWSYFVLTCLLIPFDRTSGPVVQALVDRFFGGAERATVLGGVFVVRNGAIVLGSLCATVPVILDQAWLFQVGILGNGATFLFAALVVNALRYGPEARAPRRDASAPVRAPIRDPRFVLVTAVNGVLLTGNTLLAVVLPLWVVEHTAAPSWALTAILTLNAAMAMGLQIPLNRLFPDARSGARACAYAGVAVGIACVFYAAGGTASTALTATGLLVVGMVIHTVGEGLTIASTPLTFALSPPEGRGHYLAFFNLGRVGQDIVGPVLLGVTLLGSSGPAWWVLGTVVAVAGLLPGLLLRGLDALDDAEAGAGPRPAVEAMERADAD
ncbi:MFS transporter [Actinophytocola sp. NPDC049390]|uniref:MFS transporter n=1 Tax=Actinophytocola sp. NPDC049390 TaxID=3363894 RepID=UPI0037AD3001